MMANKMKKVLAVMVVAATMATGMCSITASAGNTTDTEFKFEWSNSGGRFDYTPYRYKEDNTYVYIKTVANTLPYNGYYAKTLYRNSGSNISYSASASEYRINNYTAYTIRSDAVLGSMTGKYVRIRGHYKDTTYSWGDVTILWSPDTANQSNYPTLN